MNSRKIAVAGIVAAISFLLTFLEFPIFPAVSFLKFDPSDTLIGMLVLIYGWVPAFLAMTVKSLLFLLKSGNGGPIGILMNFIAGFIFISGFHFVRKFVINNKELPAWIGYILTSAVIGVVMCFLNYFIALPVYLAVKPSELDTFMRSGFGLGITDYFKFLFVFNLIKFTIDSILAHFIFKRSRNILNV
ncbi:MAG: ECF transporter S component [Thermotogae bacterium]|nr:ECF transporter S component [Thermotogota bacterium]MCP5465718.1 ECF transporter S component [Thermotogota bacterium]HOO75264.1 ECF transporter S component [Tepiditoga sp.]